MSAFDPKWTYLLLVNLGATNGTARQALGLFDEAAGAPFGSQVPVNHETSSPGEHGGGYVIKRRR